MIDSGLGEAMCFDSLSRQLADLAISFTDIYHLVSTNAHPDHFGLSGRLQASPNIKAIPNSRDWEMARVVIEECHEAFWTRYLIGKKLYVPRSETEGHLDFLDFGRMLYATGLDPDIMLEGVNPRRSPCGSTV